MSVFYYTVGVSGSGKSTHAQKFCKNNNVIYLSTDTLRSVIGESESDQSVSGQVFRTLEDMVEFFFKTGQNCLLDATSYNKKNRKKFIDLARKYNIFIAAFVFERSLEICLLQNQMRDRRVPDDVIQRQFNNFTIPSSDEADEIFFI